MHTTSKFKESQQKVSCLLQLITTISDQEIAANIFKATLQEFSQISCQEVGEGDDLWHQLLSTGNGDESLWLRNVTLLTFLSDFVEVFCDLCSLNIEDIFPVCQVHVYCNLFKLYCLTFYHPQTLCCKLTTSCTKVSS